LSDGEIRDDIATLGPLDDFPRISPSLNPGYGLRFCEAARVKDQKQKQCFPRAARAMEPVRSDFQDKAAVKAML
jgi:hypothetical protein